VPHSRRQPRRRPALRIALAAALVAMLGLSACTTGKQLSLPTPPAPTEPPSPGHPNIVFVLTDDLSWDLVKYMPHVVALERRGMTFTNYTVTDSFCCPSRASIFTGRFPHNTHILGNELPTGGYFKFLHRGEENSTFARTLLAAGYRTAFMGKYLNRYEPESSNRPLQQIRYGAHVPPGWTAWDAVGKMGYVGYDYTVADGHVVTRYGHAPSDFLNTVLNEKANSFLRYAGAHRNPFMLEVAPFSPHQPYTPAPQDVGTFHGPYPKTPAYNRLGSPAPAWLRGRRPLTARYAAKMRHDWDLRVESVQSVDRMIADMENTLQAIGQAQNTVFVFSSDNGYHMGEYTLGAGKQTAYDTDIRVPLIVAGPGIPAGTRNSDMAENIDLRPTFEQLVGATTPPQVVDGHSLVPLLHGQRVPWRNYALVEHLRPGSGSGKVDPDRQNWVGGVPPSYRAIRSKTFVYVRYATGDREYYNLAKDPYELHDLGPTLPPERVRRLDAIVHGLVTCRGSDQCWQAGMPSNG
jgi:arylsulfatase A-like enzyme